MLKNYNYKVICRRKNVNKNIKVKLKIRENN